MNAYHIFSFLMPLLLSAMISPVLATTETFEEELGESFTHTPPRSPALAPAPFACITASVNDSELRISKAARQESIETEDNEMERVLSAFERAAHLKAVAAKASFDEVRSLLAQLTQIQKNNIIAVIDIHNPSHRFRPLIEKRIYHPLHSTQNHKGRISFITTCETPGYCKRHKPLQDVYNHNNFD